MTIKENNTDRTEALDGAPGDRIPELATRCMRKTAHTGSSIKELTYEIRDSLMALDPDITGIWCTFDWDANGEDRLRGIVIDRKSQPVRARGGEQ
ncbi:hypothetical protein [uncultured Pelagibacterium sp.]|uniref:hypothetical protein n=1 Tax=uncultured Pelagibacterium sp. TaxID=1159875 RepID=UPI0030D80D60|tara:strand:+ start:6753 stop:7037 length:285 start_codon:yes stop_codon:yes gene_type:complete